MMKRVAAVAAISLAAMQVLAGFTGVASAAGKKLGLQKHTSVSANTCTVAAGIMIVQSTSTATIWTDGTYVYCDSTYPVNGNDLSPAPKIADLSSVIVYAETDVVIQLESAASGGATLNDRTASYGGLKVTADAAAALRFDASGLPAPYGGTVTVTDTTFAGQGLVGTIYSASSVKFDGGGGTDTFDASAVSGDVYAGGNTGNDTLKSGSGDDTLDGGYGSDKLYAGDGYDSLDCDDYIVTPSGANTPGNDQCWAGAGDDTILLGGIGSTTGSLDIAAPGDGYDTVTNSGTAFALTYVDSSVAVEFDGEYIYSDTGDDSYSGGGLYSFTGSAKGDLLYGFNRLNGGAGADVIIGTQYDGSTEGSGDDHLSGGGGRDKIRGLDGDDVISGDSGADTVRGGPGNDAVYGGGGDDVLYGLGGVDFLKGGTGLDQTWGGSGVDTCSGEIRESCEFRKG